MTRPKSRPRRHLLCAGLLAALPASARATPIAPMPLAATWAAADGSYHAGILSLSNSELVGQSTRGQRPQNTIELPTRAHAVLPAADRSLIVVARRPGDWLLRWRPGSSAEPEWVWAGADRSFNGHAIFSADGARLFTTETDAATGAGLIGVRDARSLRLLAEWPTHGIDPHELLLDAGGQLIVANGGVPTQPETGRARRDMSRMDSSLVRLHATTGQRLAQWRLLDTRLSLRHLARMTVAGKPHIGIALQAEHDDPAQRAAAPVLALLDGQQLRTCAAPPLAGYGGSIVAWQGQWVVSCPRVHGVARFDAGGRWLGQLALTEACALAVAPTDETLWVGGRERAALYHARHASTHHARHASTHHAPGLRLDNHWAPWPHAGQGRARA
ncbi:DUF1513 domain-containing protein [Ottowia testudinis]|uniref:DUF1513 domain-containing protein n=1 Tax=Ottowia testudinis TaxID=2816950 RepID=A0A975CJW8_9BURK|nr:DUF1513 domain-containing protein [Ottowia testudinis]QTD46357.1 DUF1513 domain-containing protein [Ottowia testudinis]